MAARRVPRPQSRMYQYMDQDMFFKVWVTLRASRVEKWIRYVKKEYLDAAPTKCVSLDASSPTLSRVFDRRIIHNI